MEKEIEKNQMGEETKKTLKSVFPTMSDIGYKKLLRKKCKNDK